MNQASSAGEIDGVRSVVHVIADLHVGGVGRMLVKNVRSLSDHGVRSTVISLGQRTDLVEDLVRAGATVAYVRHRGGVWLPATIYRVIRATRINGAQVVTAHLLLDRLIAGVVCALSRLPLVVTLHWELHGSRESSSRRSSRVLSLLERAITPRVADLYIAVSPSIRDDATKCGRMSRVPIEVLGAGVDLNEFRPPSNEERGRARHRLGIEDATHLVVGVGRLHAVKDFANCIRALALVKERPLNVRLIVVGEGEERSDLERLAVELDVADRASFVGQVSSPREYLWAADSFVLSSVSEGMPNALVEALAVGLIPIVTDIPATRSILPDHDLHFMPGDAEGLARVLEARLRLSPDDLDRRRRASLSCAARFDQQTAGLRLLDLFRSVQKVAPSATRGGRIGRR